MGSVQDRKQTRKRIGKKVWVGLGVVFLLIMGLSGWFIYRSTVTGSKAITGTSTAIMQTTTVKRANLVLSANGSGILEANKTADLNFSTKGTVGELLVKLGERVSKGQKLAALADTDSLQAAVAQKNLLYLQAQQELTDLQNNAGVALSAAYQSWVSAKDAYTDTAFSYERMDWARCSKEVITRKALIVKDAKEKLDKLSIGDYGSDAWIEAKNVYEMDQANYEYCTAFTGDEKNLASANLDIAKAKLNLAESNYNDLKAASGVNPKDLAIAEAKVSQTKAALDDAQKKLDGATLIAPIDGIVISIAAKQGSIVDTSTFITLADRSQPYVEIEVDESDLDLLAVGNKVTVVFDALPDLTFTGKVTEVDPQLGTTEDYQVGKGLALLDGDAATVLEKYPLKLNAAVEVVSREAQNALVVPLEALRELGDGEYGVFVKNSNGSLTFRTVEVGLKETVKAEILSGLSEGDTVTTGTVPTSK